MIIILFSFGLIEPILGNHTLDIVTAANGISVNMFWKTGVLIPSIVLESSRSQLTVTSILFAHLSDTNISSSRHLTASEKSVFPTMVCVHIGCGEEFLN